MKKGGEEENEGVRDVNHAFCGMRRGEGLLARRRGLCSIVKEKKKTMKSELEGCLYKNT